MFEPRQTTHGFQFARIEGHPDRLTPDDVTGIVVHTDLRRTGWFRCSDERLNRFHDITEWSFRDNACEIPTDCPRPRAAPVGQGDWQLFIPTGAFLYDVAGFSLKWLRDVAAEQLDDGRIINYSPDPLRQHISDTGRWLGLQGSSGWGDAIVMVPWEMWRAYGDRDVLVEMWPHMVSWVEFAATAARLHRHKSRAGGPSRGGAARAVHLGRHLPLGRMDRAGCRGRTITSSATRVRSARRSSSIPRPWPPASAGCSVMRPTRLASKSWPPTCSRRGAPNSSGPTVR